MSSINRKLFKIAENEKKIAFLAGKLIIDGLVIGLPTDTVYGLAADATNDCAIEKLYEIKKRDLKKPIAICVGQVEEVNRWGVTVNIPENLLEALLPGPVTILLKRTDTLEKSLNPGVEKIGIRIPDNKFIRDIANLTRRPLALTSANLSDRPSTLDPEEFRDLWDQLAAVFDGGKIGKSSASRAGSTVIDLSELGKYKIVREGCAYKETLDILHKFELKNKDEVES
ncbi:unnamed protein product [Bemisia tabaci]|uniref:Threonylcarbamoyl-AMP synthase n=1 Tax=Bemisia tabaci TaxID=7038 RepID=A0A9P0A5X8_BEMTA|nr:unnamed protein product [Bemisia tabaci]